MDEFEREYIADESYRLVSMGHMRRLLDGISPLMSVGWYVWSVPLLAIAVVVSCVAFGIATIAAGRAGREGLYAAIVCAAIKAEEREFGL